MLKKRLISGLAAFVLAAGAVAAPIGDSGASLLVPEISASAAQTIDVNNYTIHDLEKYSKSVTTEEFIQFCDDNKVAYILEKQDDGGCLFTIYYAPGSLNALVFYEKTKKDEYIWYYVIDNKAYIAGYTGGDVKKEFTIPKTIAGKKVIGVGGTIFEGLYHTDYSYELQYGGGVGEFHRSKTLKRLYVPKFVKDITAAMYVFNNELSGIGDVEFLVNKGSYAHKFVKGLDGLVSYSVVPDDYESDNSIKNATIKLSKTQIAYTGKARTVGVTVKSGSTKLKKGTDYTLTFKNNKNTGKATVTIKGKGKYSGSVTKSFIIVPKKPAKPTAKALGNRKVRATVKKTKLATGYQIQCSTTKKFTKSTTTTATLAKYTKNTKTFTKLKKGKVYYLRSRSYIKVGSKKYYGAYSAVKSVRCK